MRTQRQCLRRVEQGARLRQGSFTGGPVVTSENKELWSLEATWSAERALAGESEDLGVDLTVRVLVNDCE